MPKANEKVLAMVRQEVEKDSSVTNKALMTKAKRIDRSVGRLSPQQFHAMYRLRVTRAMAKAAAPRKRGRKATTRKAAARRKAAAPLKVAVPRKAAAPQPRAVNRDAIRAVLLELATEVAAADKAAVIGVVGSLERYVDRVVAAV